MRLNDTINFPKNMTLGAIADESLIYEVGKEIGKQCRAIGVHVNFAPVVDINSNPENPIIGIRSFGEFKEEVARRGKIFAKGLQDAGCIACAKHFPGHGDTCVDSHLDLPVVEHTINRLEQEELYPFKILIDSGVGGIMSAHLAVPAIDDSCLPASVSRLIVTDLLKKKLGFEGLVFTDGMNMGGITKMFRPEEAALRAIHAGNDILLCPLDVENSIDYLVQAVKNGLLDEKEIDEHVLKILKVKEQLALHESRLIPIDGIDSILHSEHAINLKKRLYQNAITVIHNDDRVLPLECVSRSNVGIVDIGCNLGYDDVSNLSLPLDAGEIWFNKALGELADFDTIVLRLFKVSKKQGVYGRVPEIDSVVKRLFCELDRLDKKIVIILCMSPYALRFLPNVPTIVAYENDPDAVEAAIETLL
jgi:beta-glucosidase-like glycosyl hydrolase